MSWESWAAGPALAGGLLIGLCAVAGCGAAQGAGSGGAAGKRIVFLGDSITDGFTYPLLVRQALAEAGKPRGVFINAGVASDTAADMRKRLDRDVLAHRPDLVALSVGVNDALRNVTLASYEADVRAIMERMRKSRVAMLVLTTSILGEKNAKGERRLGEFNAALRRMAGEFGWAVADVGKHMKAARGRGAKLLEADGVHLNFAGYRVMAAAVLEGLGYKGVPVPAKMHVEPLAGLVTPWRLKAVAAKSGPPAALDERSVAAVKPDESWVSLSLPEKGREDHWWRDQIRRRGYALSVAKLAGKAKRYIGWATISAKARKRVYFNTGAQLETIWLNGKRIYRSEGWTGYHAGKERGGATLRPGQNVIVIEAGGEFFLSVTDNNTW